MVYHGIVFKFRDLVDLILHRFQHDHYWFSVFGYKSMTIALNVAFIEAVTGSTLSITVLFAEAGGHMLSVDIVTAIRLIVG